MNLTRPLWGMIASVVTLVIFALATRIDVYNATSPPALSQALFGGSVMHVAHPWWLSLHFCVRKTYSIIAFALVGFTLDRALGFTARPALRAALIVAAFSLSIEIFQASTAPEPLFEHLLDVGCGALGGWLAVSILRAIAANRRRVPIARTSGDR